MGKSKEIATTHDIVKEILIRKPESRNSDNVLFYLVCEKVGNDHGIDINSMSMTRFLLNASEFKFLPKFETVRRTRQKIQHDDPSLSGNSKVEAYRLLNEQAFKDYARGF